jgi:hypothetical protein
MNLTCKGYIMKNKYEIISMLLLYCVGISSTGTAKLTEENARLKSENQRLKTALNSKENGATPEPAQNFQNKGALQSLIQHSLRQTTFSPERTQTNTTPQSLIQQNPLRQVNHIKMGWIETQANAAKKWKETHELRKVMNTKLSFEELKKQPSIAWEIREIKENADKEPKELAKAVLELFGKFNVNVNDENVHNTLIYPLLKEIYQSQSKDTDKGQVMRAARLLGILINKKPDLFQLRKLRTLLQWES